MVSHKHPFIDSGDITSQIHGSKSKLHHDWQMASHYRTIDQIRHFQTFLPNYNKCMDARGAMLKEELEWRHTKFGCECGSESCPCEDLPNYNKCMDARGAMLKEEL